MKRFTEGQVVYTINWGKYIGKPEKRIIESEAYMCGYRKGDWWHTYTEDGRKDINYACSLYRTEKEAIKEIKRIAGDIMLEYYKRYIEAKEALERFTKEHE